MKILRGLFLPSRVSFLLDSSRLNSPQRLSTLHQFDEIPHRDHDTYRLNATLSSHLRSGDTDYVLLLFQQMRASGLALDSYSFTPVLSACSTSPALGRQLHALMVKYGCLSSPITATSLLHMYSNNNQVEHALSVFDEMPTRDAVTWNALISSLVIHGLAAGAVAAFRSMWATGVLFTGFTLCSLLKACAALRARRQGRQIHARVISTGYDSLVMATALIDFYSSCRQVDIAIEVFNSVKCPKDSAIHNALANACVKNRCFHEVFALVAKKMKPLNVVFLTSALSACFDSSNLLYGRQLHCVVFRHGLHFDTILSNALINMYAKCGDSKSAHLAFDLVGVKNVVSWTSIIDAYGIHGRGGEALRLFKRMEEEKACSNVSPNAITLLSVLSACGHSGLVDEAKECFLLMKDKHGIDPSPAHYACLIDLLGRAGRVEEAWDLFCSLNGSKEALTGPVCVAMLNACRVSMDFTRGDVVVMHLLELDPSNPSFYVQVSNFYGAFGRWERVEELRKVLMSGGLKKELGISQIAA